MKDDKIISTADISMLSMEYNNSKLTKPLQTTTTTASIINDLNHTGTITVTSLINSKNTVISNAYNVTTLESIVTSTLTTTGLSNATTIAGDAMKHPSWTVTNTLISDQTVPAASTMTSVIASNPLTPLWLLVILVIALTANLLVMIAVRLDRQLHSLTYYFFVSIATLHILMTVVAMPPAILIALAGEFSGSQEMCKLWVTADLFFCNNMCLHLAFTNMDSFLRLKDPQRRGRRRTPMASCSIVLWLGAPWAISLVQSMAQFMLSQADKRVVSDGVCFVSDKNFAVLGTLFSFIIPLAVAILFQILCTREIKMQRRSAGKRLLSTEEGFDDTNGSVGFRYSSKNSLENSDCDDNNDDEEDDINMSETTSCVSDSIYREQPPAPLREHLQLAVVTNIKDNNVTEKSVQQNIPTRAVNDDESALLHDVVTSFCQNSEVCNKVDDINKPRNTAEASQQNTSSFADHIMSADQSSSCTLLLRDGRESEVLQTMHGNNTAVNCHGHMVKVDVELDHCPTDESLRKEHVLCNLLGIILVITITLWTPHAASNVIYAICRSCRFESGIELTFSRSSIITWLAYSSAAFVPLTYFKWCPPLRHAYIKVVTCDTSIWYKRFK